MAAVRRALGIVVLGGTIGWCFYQASQISVLRRQNAALQNRQTSLEAQLDQLQHEREDLAQRFNDQSKRLSVRETELARLQAQQGSGMTNGSGPLDSVMQSWGQRVALLKQKLEQMPERKIPELQFVTEKDWADAAWNGDLSTEDGVREALSKVRQAAEDKFLNEMMKDAFKKYLAAHDNILPPDLFELKPYFDAPVTDDMLQRYKLLQTGRPDNSADLVTLQQFADPYYDSTHTMSMNGAYGGSYNRVGEMVGAAIAEYLQDHAGQIPSDPAQVAPYLASPLEPSTIQKYLAQAQADPPPPEVVTLMPALRAFGAANNGQQPDSPFQLVPYLTSPDQQSAFLKLEQLPPEAVTLIPALQSYLAAHNGQAPSSASDLAGYITTPDQQAALQKIGDLKGLTARH